MDADRFDNLLRFMAARPSRRGIGHALAGITLTGALAPLFGLTNGDAKRRKNKKKKCKGKKKRCGKKCAPKGKCCSGKVCTNGQQCSGGVCATPPACLTVGSCVNGAICCSGNCIPIGPGIGTCSTISDPGEPCLATVFCSQGECIGFVCTV